MKHIKWLTLGFVIGGLLVWSTAHAAAPFDVNAKSALVVNATTDEVVMGKNADDVRPIASITKMMTAIITLDSQLPLDEEITISNEDVKATMLRGRPYSGSLTVGTTLTRSELLHLALMNSQNRAAAALARSYPGGTNAFVQAMNAKAASLGMTNTHFVDSTGLMSANVSTARDLALMAKHAASYEIIQQMSTAEHLDTYVRVRNQDKPAHFGTTNRLLKTAHWDIDIQKTGYINAAGRCLLMVTNVDNSPFIVVLLNTSSSYNRAADAIKIKSWIETGEVVSRSQLATLNPYKVTTKHKKKKHNKRR